MAPSRSDIDFFSLLAGPFTGEALFDCLPDVVFFVKNRRGEYVVVNQTLAARCGCRDKAELIGRRADTVFPPPFGPSYRAQDERVLRGAGAVRNHMELHFYVTGGRGWCLTHKFPLYDRGRLVVGLAGISRDVRAPNERGEDYSRMAHAIQKMQTRFGETLRVGDLAAEAGLSPYQFEQRLRRIFQLTAGQLLQKIRMDHAMQRLQDTDESISAIAQRCGYADQSAFTRQFSKTSGATPQQYRRAFAPGAHL